MNTVIEYTTKETAKLIKQELNGSYSHIKFSVTVAPKRSMLSGNKIEIRFTATEKEIKEIEKLVEKYRHNQIVDELEIKYNVNYLFVWAFTAKVGA